MVDEFSEVSVYPALTVFQSAGLELSGQRLLMWVRQTLRLGTVNIDTVQQLCTSYLIMVQIDLLVGWFRAHLDVVSSSAVIFA